MDLIDHLDRATATLRTGWDRGDNAHDPDLHHANADAVINAFVALRDEIGLDAAAVEFRRIKDIYGLTDEIQPR